DRFGPAQPSSSKQAFRQAFRQNGPIASPGAATPADFAAQANKSQQQHQGPGAFNFAEMHRELGGAPQVDWSSDFARHQAAHAGGGGAHSELEHAFARANTGSMMHMHPMARQHANWAEQFHHQPARQAATLASPASVAAAAATTVAMRADPMAMAFNEARMYSMMPGPGMMRPQMMPQQWQQQQQVGGAAEQSQMNATTAHVSDLPDVLSTNDDLADTASQILESVRNTANPKFKNSEFFSFMHQLADRQATISGDQVITDQKGKQADPQALAASGPTWATEFEKRAGELVNREVVTASVNEQTPQDGQIFSEEFARGLERNWAEEFEQTLSGPLKESAVSGHPQEMDIKLDQPSSQYIHGEAQEDWLEQFKDKIQPMLSEQDREWLDTQKEWEKLNSAETAHRAVDPELNIYRFQTDNYYAQMTPEALSDAVQQMRQSPESASLGDAILALESTVTQSPQDAQAWLQLGLKQQENEQEQAAIAALRKAISLNSSSLDAHLALAVSYTNEGYQMDAYDELHEWVSRHDRYKTLVSDSALESMSSSDTRKAYVQDLFIKAARMSPGQDWDPDVQVALGVLFNISTEYDKAVDCFKAALSKRPDDYILWNRLGATEAHIGNNKEATAAYFRALELHPSFIRARYNLSLASTNMGQHREAAENCLIALSLQQRELNNMGEKGMAAHADATRSAPAGGMSSTIWNALQLSMYMLGEPSLAEACEKQDLDAFRSKFDF
ncbi:hypothetical protein IWW38_001843, partial [Coemansia aciculifera]